MRGRPRSWSLETGFSGTGVQDSMAGPVQGLVF